ncbi:MAG TPA: thiolase family protein [Deltaproteobacteria bacterium]|nr:thiolase family protein [Deltaproteobacteria bacterium]HPJ93732.1 thiolase family protein [Deltaproteobacteria bacterium]HPR50664.1 thiolase family protein [Deltaproteobacteria bacterium]
MDLRDAYFVDGVRTWFGKSRPDGFYWTTRADDLVVKVMRELMKRNPDVPWDQVDDNIWGATTQEGDQGTTMGRTTVLTAGLPDSIAGFSVDRMCAGGMTCQAIGSSFIKTGSADIIIAGGVEHMAHHPMGATADPNPRIVSEKMVEPKYFSMGVTAEKLHDWMPENGEAPVSKEEADEYALMVTKRYFDALDKGYYDKHCVNMSVFTPDGWKVANKDEQARRGATIEGMRNLKTPFKKAGRVTAGNSSGLNDGACVSLLMSGAKCKEYGIKPKMRYIGAAFVGVDASIMGWGPVPATEKVLKNFNMKFEDLDIIELNEAFAVQAVGFMKHFGMKLPEDPRLNPYGGTIAVGHPLASSGVRLSMQLAQDFEMNPDAKYGLTTMCVGLGMGGSILWENVVGKDF